jgi:hypothetical protein
MRKVKGRWGVEGLASLSCELAAARDRRGQETAWWDNLKGEWGRGSSCMRLRQPFHIYSTPTYHIFRHPAAWRRLGSLRGEVAQPRPFVPNT